MIGNIVLGELGVIVNSLLKYGDLSRAHWIGESKELFSTLKKWQKQSI